MKQETLKQLSARLGLSAAVLKGIQKGEKRRGGQVIANNMAKALGNAAKRTGYKDKASAEKAIEKNIRLLYIATEDLAKRVEKAATKTRKKEIKLLLKSAVELLNAGNAKGFIKLVSSNPQISFLKRSCATKIDNALLDSFRSQPKQNRKTAQALLSATGHNGEKILIKGSVIKSAIKKRLKRFGTVPSLFWEAAIRFNPKVKIKGLVKAKKTPKNKTRGASARTSSGTDGYVAEIAHHLEKESSQFRAKVNTIARENEIYWAKVAEKELISLLYLDKYLGE